MKMMVCEASAGQILGKMKSIKLKPADNVLWEEVEGEFVLLKLDQGNSYRLNRTGGRVWEGIVKRLPPEDIAAVLSEDSSNPDSSHLQDVERFLSELQAEGLVTGDE